jgi:hypothetical protein
MSLKNWHNPFCAIWNDTLETVRSRKTCNSLPKDISAARAKSLGTVVIVEFAAIVGTLAQSGTIKGTHHGIYRVTHGDDIVNNKKTELFINHLVDPFVPAKSGLISH